MIKIELPGGRRRGRPKRRFMDVPRGDMQSVRVENTEDRERWSRMICYSVFWKNLGKAERGRRIPILFILVLTTLMGQQLLSFFLDVLSSLSL